VHATIAPGARLQLPWREGFNALLYVLAGSGRVGPNRRPVSGGQLVVFGEGAHLQVTADERPDGGTPALEVVVLGGRPIGEPVAWYGPFVMNTKAELTTAVEDFRAGRFGVVPPDALMPHAVRD
jgi:redox-sensitive bicupin YhaK (pirin superfamily)